MKRISLSVAATLLVASVVVFPGEAGGQIQDLSLPSGKVGPAQSGILDSRDTSYGHFITECPQAGIRKESPKPLDHRVVDEAEKVSDRGGDVRTNEEYSCFPQNETSIAVNPTESRNVVVAQNDYRLGWATSGISASSDGGRNWYSLLAPFPSLPSGDNLDGGGDPALVFDRAGIVYYADINFNRTDDTSGIWVRRSTNGGFTWSRPCVAIGNTDAAAVCGPIGDPRQAGDGTVAFNQDNDALLNGSVPFNDKEYIAAGPRPTGVDPVCFEPVSKASTDCDPDVVGVDRIYVTWTLFTDDDSNIVMSFSDDQGRSWSPAKAISGSAPFCAFGATANACDSNQLSVPTVHPETGALGVGFQNFNTPDENQYLFVRSTDGGATFSGPFFVTPVFDVNFPRAGAAGGRPDCTARGQQAGRIVYTNSCFRSNAGGNVVFDKRGGAFADDLYLVMSDNRNGTEASSNADIFLFKSINGGSTWIGPTRVNNDPSNLGSADRDSREMGNFGNDQWWPWVDINDRGHLNITFKDRRLDTNSTASEWPASRSRPGNYLVWTFGAQCRVDSSTAAQCLAPDAAPIPQPTAPINPGPGLQPGQGTGFVGPLTNFQVSDVPSNFDYSFRAGIFAGDYDVVTVTRTDAYVHFTDARNGRSSGNATSPGGAQPGRNPACEQSDVFLDKYRSSGVNPSGRAEGTDALFLVTPCPSGVTEERG